MKKHSPRLCYVMAKLNRPANIDWSLYFLETRSFRDYESMKNLVLLVLHFLTVLYLFIRFDINSVDRTRYTVLVTNSMIKK